MLLPLTQIVCRSSTPIEMAVKEKISMFCHVNPEQVSVILNMQQTSHHFSGDCISQLRQKLLT